MTFLYQSLLSWGLPLLAVPLLIHLINLRRRRRVEWAAMDFLMDSQRRNKKWFLLRQWLLLLVRTAVIGATLLMLAGPILHTSWGELLGRGRTHHLILLDDSYSMADRTQDRSAWDLAKGALTQIVQQASRHSARGVVTLVRFSEAVRLSAGKEPSIAYQSLEGGQNKKLMASIENLELSETDAGPVEALAAAARLPEPDSEETRILYLVSDFRKSQWTETDRLRQLLKELHRQAAQLQFVQCVETAHPNLTITRLTPESGVRAAGVEMWMQIAVANHGDQTETGVTVSIDQDGSRLPSVLFDEIPPGEEVARRFRVTLADPGPHKLRATIKPDALTPDNVRYFAFQVPAAYPVLLVDGSTVGNVTGGDDGYYLQTALSPGGNQKGGWSPDVQPSSVLRKHDQLHRYMAICLLDVARLDSPEIEALEIYVRQGGGLAIWVGPRAIRPFYNEQLFKGGTGLMPVALDVPTELVDPSHRDSPDVEVTAHPLFRMFQGQRNSFLSVVSVNLYYGVDLYDGIATNPPGESDRPVPAQGGRSLSDSVRVLARLRSGAPWIVEKRLGKGRVVLQLGKLSPKPTELGAWSNWALNPVFPVYANELMGYLSGERQQDSGLLVGDRLRMTFPSSEYSPEYHLRQLDGQPRQLDSRGSLQTMQPIDEAPRSMHQPGDLSVPQYQMDIDLSDIASQINGATRTSGFWKIELQPHGDSPKSRLVAVNVPPAEGDLHHLDREKLSRQLEGIEYRYLLASMMTASENQLAGYRLSDTLLGLWMVLLIAELLLANSASYHHRANHKTP